MLFDYPIPVDEECMWDGVSDPYPWICVFCELPKGVQGWVCDRNLEGFACHDCLMIFLGFYDV